MRTKCLAQSIRLYIVIGHRINTSMEQDMFLSLVKGCEGCLLLGIET